MLENRSILLVISGGIAAYKSLDLIRRLRERRASVTPVMTRAAEEFITPLSVAALSENKVHRDLFSLSDESEMSHIELSRSADLIIVAPATANLMSDVANGQARDLATTLLLATDTQILIAPSMNVRMWEHAATQRNFERLRDDGVAIIGPNEGEMACGEYGAGRMAEPDEIVTAAEAMLGHGPLSECRVVITSGPTHEAIDPVRYISNQSSGRQGVAIAESLARLGAEVEFVTGPAKHSSPVGCHITRVQSAREMEDAVHRALPADVAIFAAAVADWRIEGADQKIKKSNTGGLKLRLLANPDILAGVAGLRERRPRLVVGFAAETEHLIENARIKRQQKGCDWLLANDVSAATQIMGGSENEVFFLSNAVEERWARASKREIANRLSEKIMQALL